MGVRLMAGQLRRFSESQAAEDPKLPLPAGVEQSSTAQLLAGSASKTAPTAHKPDQPLSTDGEMEPPPHAPVEGSDDRQHQKPPPSPTPAAEPDLQAMPGLETQDRHSTPQLSLQPMPSDDAPALQPQHFGDWSPGWSPPLFQDFSHGVSARAPGDRQAIADNTKAGNPKANAFADDASHPDPGAPSAFAGTAAVDWQTVKGDALEAMLNSGFKLLPEFVPDTFGRPLYFISEEMRPTLSLTDIPIDLGPSPIHAAPSDALMAVITGTALAAGNETSATGSLSSTANSNEWVTTYEGFAHFTASAETADGSTPFAHADTQIDFANADYILIITTHTLLTDVNSAYAVSNSVAVAIDLHGWSPSEGPVIYSTTMETQVDFDSDVFDTRTNGTTAEIMATANAFGSNSDTQAATLALAVQDSFSIVDGKLLTIIA